MDSHIKAMDINFQMNVVLKLKHSHIQINSTTTKCRWYFGTHCMIFASLLGIVLQETNIEGIWFIEDQE